MNRRGILAAIIALTLTTGTAAYAVETAPAAPTSPAAEIAPAPVVAAAAPLAAPLAAPAAAAAATPLAPRATKPLTLAPKDEGTPFGYKLLAGLGLAAAAGLWLHKKKKDAGGDTKKKKKPAARIDILSRQSVGVRNELLVVDVEGTRLLVGMTPGAMQTLAVLEQPDALTEMSDESRETTAERKATERIAQPAPSARASAYEADEEDEDEDELPPVSFVPSKPRATTSVSALDQKVRSLLANRPAPSQMSQTSTPSNIVPKRRRGNNPSKTARIAGQAKGLLLAMSDDSETPARSGEM